MNAQNIKELLNSMVGEPFRHWDWYSMVFNTVRKACLAQNIIDENNPYQHLTYTVDRQMIFLYYDRCSIGYIKLKKSKGQSHSHWGETWCDWTIAGFDVELYYDTIEAGVQAAIDYKNKVEQNRQNTMVDLSKIVKQLMAEKNLDYYQVIAMLEAIGTMKLKYSPEFKALCEN